VTAATFEHVTKRFGATVALDDVSFVLTAGETTVLLGPNGAGKSTLAGLLLGLRAPDSGRVRISGRDPRDHRARVALAAVPQETLFPQTLRARELVEFAAAHYPHARPAGDVLAEFGLDSLAERQVGGFSVGQRRRLAVALALVGRPSLLVLDEPTAALDAEARGAVWAAVDRARVHGAAILLATHQLDEAEAVATRVVALDAGAVVADGSVADVRRRAGGMLVRFRAGERPLPDGARWDGDYAVIECADAGAAVRGLVLAEVPLSELEVRPLSLEEAIRRLRDPAAP
jgi:ABC-2 type transport system ATP-binding protein